MNKDDTFVSSIARQLWNGSAVVFVGAGFSRNADSSYPLWNGLADQMWKQLHDSSDGKQYVDVLGLAEEYQAAFDRPQLDSLLLSACYKPRVSCLDVHKELLALPWADVLTTNYDTLLEQATEHVGNIRYSVVLNKDDLSIAQRPRIIKLHGSFPSERPFVITARDYRRYPYDHAAFVNTVRQSIIENTLVLMGFSGDDPNFLSWLEWVHIQQGECGTRKIYMLGIADISDSRRKLLLERGIEYHDIVSYYGTAGDVSRAFLSFFKDVNERSENIDEWPSFPDDMPFVSQVTNGSEQEIEKRCEILERLYAEYPGWIVPPPEAMEWLYLRLSLKDPLLPDSSKPIPQKLVIRYYRLLAWIYEISLTSWPDRFLESASVMLSSISDVENVDYTDVIEISIGILKAKRERGVLDSRDILLLRNFETSATSVQRAKLWYEICLRDVSVYNLYRLATDIEKFDVGVVQPIWSVRKAGLLLLCGEHDKARDILVKTITQIRSGASRQFRVSKYEEMSTESAAQTLLYRITAAFSLRGAASKPATAESADQEDVDEVNNYMTLLLKPHPNESTQEDENRQESETRREKQRFFDRQYELKKFKCDMQDVVQGIAASIGLSAVDYPAGRVPFDLVESQMAVERRYDIYAEWRYNAFNRVFHVLGWPLRIENWVYAKSELISTTCSLCSGQYGLAVATLVDYGSVDAIDRVLTRKYLSEFDEKYRRQLAKSILRHISKCLDGRNITLRSGAVSFLSKFVLFSQLSDRRVAAQICKKLYERASSLPFEHYETFIVNFAQSLRSVDVANILQTLAEIRPDRKGRPMIMNRLPNIFMHLTKVNMRGSIKVYVNQRDVHHWLACLGDGGAQIDYWSLVNLLSTGVMGLLRDRDMEQVRNVLTDRYWRLNILSRFPSCIHLLFRKPWIELLKPFTLAEDFLQSSELSSSICIDSDSPSAMISAQRKLDFIALSIGEGGASLTPNRTREVLSVLFRWLTVLHEKSPQNHRRELGFLRSCRYLQKSISWVAILLIASAQDDSLSLAANEIALLKSASQMQLVVDVAIFNSRKDKADLRILRRIVSHVESTSLEDASSGFVALLVATQRSSVFDAEDIAEIMLKQIVRLSSPQYLYRYVSAVIAIIRTTAFRWDLWHEVVIGMATAGKQILSQKAPGSAQEYLHYLMLAKGLNELAARLREVRENEIEFVEIISKATRQYSDIFADAGSNLYT